MYLEQRVSGFVKTCAVALGFIAILAFGIGMFALTFWLGIVILRAMHVIP